MWQLNCPHVYAQASVDVIGSTAPHVNVEQIRNFQLVLPPLAEQRRIAAWIRAECTRVEDVLARIEREITLLREYRTRLVADVVTGQLDVREAAARLPAEELEPLDEGAALGDEDGDAEELDGEAEGAA
jgi:type I restriction enzyme S subunit